MAATKGKTQFKGVFMLLLTAFVWGTSFVAQSVGMERIDAFTFNGIRTLMGAAALLPFLLTRDLLSAKKHNRGPGERAAFRAEKRKLIVPGICMGLALCAAGNVQQFAFKYTTPGKIAFITAFYMFFVPVLGIFIGKRIRWVTWCCVFMGVVGLYFLCVTGEGFSAVNRGDLLSLACSVLFAVHILVIEHFSGFEDSIALSFIQFTTSGLVTICLMFIFEKPDLKEINAAILPLLYSGVMSCGFAYTFQVVGQKYTESTVASILMCMESVFGVLSSAVLLRQMLTGREIAGCVIMFAAIIISQFSDRIADGLKRKTDSPKQQNTA